MTLTDIRLNSIESAAFDPASLTKKYSGDKERADIIAGGRLLMQERNGRDNNAIRAMSKMSAEFTPKIDDLAYSIANADLKRKTFLYCAKKVCEHSGEAAPATMEDFCANQRHFMKDGDFLKVLSGIVRETITPVLPAVIGNALRWLAQTVSVPVNKTLELDVASNDVIMFQDDSWGASGSKPAEDLYSYPISINPHPYTAHVNKKWHQMIGNDVDLGAFYASIAAGMYSKVMALWVKYMVSASTNTFYTPAAMSFNTNSSSNVMKAIKRTKLANGGGFQNVIGFGDIEALGKLLPAGISNGSGTSLDTALATMLGQEYIKYGYLTEYMGASLMVLDNALVPGTQNTTMTELVPSNMVWFASTVGKKPVILGFEEGSPIEVEITPKDSADDTLDIKVTSCMDVVPIFASKVSNITV